MPFGRSSHCSEADLSAYLDAQLASAAKERCEAHLRVCGRCSEALESLSAVRSSVRALPQVTAPRSFRLRQAHVDAAPMRRPLLVQAMPMLSGLSAASVVAFVVLVGLNATGRVDLGTSSDSKSVPGSVMSASRETAADSSAPEFSDNAAASATVSPPSAATSDTPQAEAGTARNSQFLAADQAGGAAEATRTASSAPEPAVLDSSGDDGGSDTALHIAEAVAAAIALGSGGLALTAYRRTR